MDNPSDVPQQNLLDSIEEPYLRASVITPSSYGIFDGFMSNRRGSLEKWNTFWKEWLVYRMPLAEVVMDF